MLYRRLATLPLRDQYLFCVHYLPVIGIASHYFAICPGRTNVAYGWVVRHPGLTIVPFPSIHGAPATDSRALYHLAGLYHVAERPRPFNVPRRAAISGDAIAWLHRHWRTCYPAREAIFVEQWFMALIPFLALGAIVHAIQSRYCSECLCGAGILNCDCDCTIATTGHKLFVANVLQCNEAVKFAEQLPRLLPHDGFGNPCAREIPRYDVSVVDGMAHHLNGSMQTLPWSMLVPMLVHHQLRINKTLSIF